MRIGREPVEGSRVPIGIGSGSVKSTIGIDREPVDDSRVA